MPNHPNQQVPLVSVLVPCYNYADYVGEAIQSILSQDYPNLELIIVDDGSTDHSVAVIESNLRDWQRIPGVQRAQLIQQQNQGVSSALNTALAAAQGEYIATFDADDVMPSGRLQVQVEYLQDRPEVGCLGGRTVRIDPDSQRLPSREKRRAIKRYDFNQALEMALVVGGNVAMYRRAAINAVGGYDQHIVIQDFQMTLKVAHAGYAVHILPQVVTLYRKHPESLSNNYRLEYASGLQVIEAYADHPAYPSARAKLTIKALRSAATDDKSLAWSLVRQVPLRYWDAQMFRRLRHLIFKRSVGRNR